MTDGEICSLLCIAWLDVNLFGSVLCSRSILVIFLNVVIAGVACYFCHAAVTAAGTTTSILTFGSVALLSSVTALLGHSKPRPPLRVERG